MNINIARFCITLFALLSVCFTPFAFAAKTVVDVMVVYTPGVATTYGGDPTTRINQIFAFTNQIYTDSGVNLEIHLVKTVEVNYADTGTDDDALSAIQTGSGVFSGIAALRDQYKADAVIFYRKYDASHNYCGLAYIGGYGSDTGSMAGYKGYMYGTMSLNTCPDYVTSHELGHNMGLRHSRKQDTRGGAFHYALGYGIDNQFTTIMAYESQFGDPSGSKKVYKFSSPSLVCAGVACGVDKTNTTTGADAVHALSVTTPQLAEFYAGSVSASSKTDVETANDNVTTARTANDAALAALEANKADIANKTALQKEAKSALSAATSAAKAATKAYDGAVKTYNKSTASVTSLASKVATALDKYNASTTDAARAKTLTAYNTVNASHTAAVTKAASDLAAISPLQTAVTNATTALTAATNAHTLAANNLAAAKAATAALKATAATTKAALAAAIKAYNAAVKAAAKK